MTRNSPEPRLVVLFKHKVHMIQHEQSPKSSWSNISTSNVQNEQFRDYRVSKHGGIFAFVFFINGIEDWFFFFYPNLQL